MIRLPHKALNHIGSTVEQRCRKANSFEDAQQFDTAHYLNLSSAERVETVQVLREAHFK
jgi:hypothetical protein